MKFGKYLKENTANPWKLEYIQYDLLKNDLKNRQLDHDWNEEDEDAFIKLFTDEKNKVTQFIRNFTQQLLARIKYCDHLIKKTKDCDQAAQKDESELPNTNDFSFNFLNNLDDTLIEILFDIHEFSCFIRLNRLGFEKILKKHKRWTLIDDQGYIYPTESPYDLSCIESMELTHYNHQLYAEVSALRFSCQEYIYNNGKKDFLKTCMEKEEGVSEDPFIVPERMSKKYWIHPEHISEITAILCMHSFIVPKKVKTTLNKIPQLDFSMTNIYFDNNQMDVHADKFYGKSNAQVIKCKKFGSNDFIYVEDEVHNPFCLGDMSSKVRLKVEHHLLQDFCEGKYKMKRNENRDLDEDTVHQPSDSQITFAKATQDRIVSQCLHPVLQCNYDRISFEAPHKNKGLQITLDTNIKFSHYSALQETMFIENDDNNKNIRQHGFPYAVLEVKLDTDTRLDDPALYWLNTFTKKCKLLHEIPKFSKYTQGIYQLFLAQGDIRHYISTVVQGRIPAWIDLYDRGIPLSDKYATLSRSRNLRPLTNGQSYQSIIPYTRKSNNQTMPIHEINSPSILQGHHNNTRRNSDYTLISMPVDDQTTCNTSVTQNEKPAFAANINEKTTTMQFSPTIENSNKLSSHSSNYLSRTLWKHTKNSNNSSRRLTLGQDHNPIVHKNKPRGFLKSSFRRKVIDVEKQQTFEKETKTKTKKKKNLVVKIEPKVFFANERTFISWLQFCALLLTVALNLLNFGDQISRICGALFLTISAALALYALARFQYRAWQLRTPNYKGRFDDIYGPAVLCVLIVAALIINFWLRFRYVQDSDTGGTYLGVDGKSNTR